MPVRHNRRALSGAACVAALVLAMPAASAGDLGWGNVSMKDDVLEAPQYGFRIDGGVSAGYLTGTAHETVEVIGRRNVSELIWTMEDIVMISGKLEMSGSPWWKVAIEGSTNVTDDSTMDDFDWVNLADINSPPDDWTHWSHHKNTNLENVQLIDAYGVLTLFRLPGLSLSAVAGARFDKWRWVAKGGQFVYSDLENGGFRDLVFSASENETGITYEQDYEAPYLGGAIAANLGPLSIEGRLSYSSWVQSSAEDNHWLRKEFGPMGFIDNNNFDQGEMLQVDAAGKYQITPEIALSASYKYLEYSENIDQQRRQGAYGGRTFFVREEGSGMSNESEMFSLGVVYSFH